MVSLADLQAAIEADRLTRQSTEFQCQANLNLYDSPANKNFPPLPGNCITGGRTGYSVKLVSPGMVRASNIQAFGGDGTNGPIVNFLNENFLNF